jgi:HAD superfamily hydrolase (TIGR01549 family)
MSGGASQVVLIDLDDTCVPDRSATNSALARMLRRLGLPGEPEAVSELLAASRARWQGGPFHQHCLEVGISSWEGLWLRPKPAYHPDGFASWITRYQREVWAGAALGEPAHRADEIAGLYHQIRAEECIAYPGVRDYLRKQRELHGLWLITNGDSELQRRKLSLSRLDAEFDRVFVSGEIGAVKPAAEFFRPVEACLREQRAEVALVIGDSFTADLAPALARGWPVLSIGQPAQGVPWVQRLAEAKI